ncbi:MAG: lipoyl synthase, partial [Candidatus Auribacterota bacterium]|nr:lipoyl synthase [Candidatus Auribacterota bacterium]
MKKNNQSLKRLPKYLLKKVELGGETFKLKKLLRSLEVSTVCEEALCPNITECFKAGELTFMLMGSICSRNCGFCGVTSGIPSPLDLEEPEKISDAAERLKLKYVVLTSVTRDDLPDGGAGHFAACIRKLKDRIPGVGVEVLIPDFQGDREALGVVLRENPEVLAHNLETVKRIYHQARAGSNYHRSLEVLGSAAKIRPDIPVKSGFMVGLGETDAEIEELMRDIRATGCTMLTIGHYLPPTRKNIPLVNLVPPEKFEEYRDRALKIGFKSVSSGIFVRSSYHAREHWMNWKRD